MILETNNKKVNLVYRTKNIVKVTKLLNGKNFEEIYFNAISENDVEALAKVILIFGEDVDSGITKFKSEDEVYAFIDDYMAENNKTYGDIFKTIAEDINEMGFFNSKMTQEELMNKMSTHMAINMEEIVKASAEKAITNMAEKEFKGYKG